ncbi:MAG: lipid-A-disaccharide synthase N-terminal domain-containing protein [Syntrophobacteraceae bacterium]|nr:lipid-A-disaccharide synthase N-terminal domain-containing protein [Desulfobacteraceae bacterium]
MTAEYGLLVLGFVAQGLFTARFLVQWVVSERAGKSVVPVAFWLLSVLGGGLLLVYAVLRRDPVFILGQAGGLLIYLRNLYLIFRERSRQKETGGSERPES